MIINSRAGSVDASLVEAKVREALFRCDLRFSIPKDLAEMDLFIADEINHSQFFMICGGDGTINVTLQSLIRQSCGKDLPPICVVRSGTANDLAYEIGASQKIESAARSILEGEVKRIDLIELCADNGQKTFMITNGGIGIPAAAADAANRLRGALQTLGTNPRTATTFRQLAQHSYNLVKKMGPTVYSVMAFEAMRNWDGSDWEVEIEIPNRKTIITNASCVLVNNQPTMGQSMTPAPFTSNSDGLINLLITDAANFKDQFRTVMSLRNGNPEELSISQSFEVPSFRLKSRTGARSLTFFGDGEILLKDVREISVRCLHRGLPVVVRH